MYATTKMVFRIGVLVCIVLAGLSFVTDYLIAQKSSASRQDVRRKAIEQEPGGTQEDAGMAINESHEYAWRLFLFINRQALAGAAGEPDPSRPTVRDYFDDKPVVWETWAGATGGLFLRPAEVNRSEVYRARGEKPVPWTELKRAGANEKVFEPDITNIIPKLSKRIQESSGSNKIRLLFDPSVRDDFEFEVRMNRSTYDTIRDEGLHSVEGLETKFREALKSGKRDVINFNRESKEIKAKWVRIKETDRDRYHWRTNVVKGSDGKTATELWGLAGLHIITKDLPNWFWTDFEHVDFEPLAIKDGRPSVDPTTRGPSAASGADGVRNETKGSKWQYYRLRGVQIEFVDKFGGSTQLANSLIEPASSGQSSCITCHAKATVGLEGGIGGSTDPNMPFNARTLVADFVLGLPDPKAFYNNKLLFIQTDFVWSMGVRARRVNVP